MPRTTQKPDPEGETSPPVVPSPEHAPVHAVATDGGLSDAELVEVDLDSTAGVILPTAEHHHLGDVGPVNSPAGAHRHNPDDPPHEHPVPAIVDPPASIRPRPAVDDTGKPEKTDKATYTVTRDCRAVVNSQLVEFKAGEEVEASVGRYLLDTGAPVSTG